MLITEIKYQIATTVKWKYSCAVLGLAACHVSQNCNEKLQVRPAGQAGYPISLVASLDTVPVKCCVPLHYLRREKGEEKGRKFYIYPDVTHTHTQTITHLSTYGPRAFVYVYVFIYIYIHKYIHKYIYIYIYTHIYRSGRHLRTQNLFTCTQILIQILTQSYTQKPQLYIKLPHLYTQPWGVGWG